MGLLGNAIFVSACLHMQIEAAKMIIDLALIAGSASREQYH